ncbi:MAG: cupin domain-containing protein [Opitutae bacterium]
MKTVENMINHFSMIPHPEGGWFRRSYQSHDQIDSPNGARPLMTSIFYLLEKEGISRLHLLDADETWYFHGGSPLQLHLFHETRYEACKLGNPIQDKDAHPQYTIPAGTIFGAISTPCLNEAFSFVSCSVSPGFIQTAFSWPNIPDLKRKFKNYSHLIEKLSISVKS